MAYLITPELRLAEQAAASAKTQADIAADQLAPRISRDQLANIKLALADGIITREEAASIRPLLDLLTSVRNPTVNLLVANFRAAATASNDAARARDFIKVKNQLPDPVVDDEIVVVRRGGVWGNVNTSRPGANTWDGRPIRSDGTVDNSLKGRLREVANDAVVDAVRRSLNGY